MNLQNDNANPGEDRVTLNGAVLILSGNGTANVKVSRNVSLVGSSLETENGNLTVEANQQTTPTAGFFDGVGGSAGEIKVTGTGALTVRGRGGDAPAGSSRGINVSSGGKIMGGSGMVTVNGTGGASVGNNNIGVLVITSSITSSGGAVSVTGQGGGSGTSSGNTGVAVSSAGQITVGGSGTVTVNGTGGAGMGNNNHGVSVRDANSRITSSSGAVSVTGTGTNGANDILMASGGAITSTSTTAGITLNSTTNGTFPNTAGTDVGTDATQKTTFGTGSKLNIDIDGTTVNTQYQQLGVVGQIDLNNAVLTFVGSTWSPVANTFTIVNNDGSDAIIGTFNGLSQGATIPNFLGSTFNAQISYTGGDGNDVVLTALTTCVAPSISAAASSNSPICAGETLNLSVGASGTEPLSYTWGGAGTFANGNTATPTVTGAATGTYTVTVTNACGSVTNTVAVVVSAAPLITATASSNSPLCMGATLNLNVGASSAAPLSYAWTGTGTFSDAGAANPSVTGAATGTYAVVVSNACGSVTSTASVVINGDNQPPVLTCPSNRSLSTAVGTCAAPATYAPTTLDNCSSAPPALSHSFSGATTVAPWATGSGSGSNFNKGITTVTLRATSAGDLTNTCTFRVIVNDMEAPTLLNCVNPPPVNAVTNTCSAVVTYSTPTFTDNCAPTSGTAVRISGPASGSAFPAGTTNVVFRATDAAGKSKTCVLVVTVVDNEPPVITCPPPTTVTGGVAPCATPVFYATPTVSDNCGGTLNLFLVSGLLGGSAFPAGTTVSTWRAVASNGQMAECTVSVTVECAGNRPGSAGDRTTTRADGIRRYVLSPNPASDMVQIAWTGGETSDPVHLAVFDVQGRLVWERAAGDGVQMVQVDVSDWATGIYLVSLRGKGGVETKRLVVAH